ncbi:TIM barrel protein [Bacteroidota bacterium]
MKKPRMIKYGLKLKTINKEILTKAIDLINHGDFHYLEIHVGPISFQLNIDILSSTKIPIVLHSPYILEGLNISTNEKLNHKIFTSMLRFANLTNAKFIIVHPGVGGNISNVISFLLQYNDPRILIENLPKYSIITRRLIASKLPNSYKMILSKIAKHIPKRIKENAINIVTGKQKQFCFGHSPEEIRMILDSTNVGFCLDFGHAYSSSCSINQNYYDIIREFLLLEPSLFHVHDGFSSDEYDHHMTIGEGNYDLPFIYQCVIDHPTKYLTLETPRKRVDSFKCDKENRVSFERLGSQLIANKNSNYNFINNN